MDRYSYAPHFTAQPTDQAVRGSATTTTPANPGREAPPPTSVSNTSYPKQYQDWFVTVTVNPHQFATSGYVHIFLCETVPSSGWMFAPERVGDVGVFKNTTGERSNCQQRGGDTSTGAGGTITGDVPLTRVLTKKGKDINNIEDIEAYLKENLHWRCQLVDETEVPLEDVSSLQVKVSSALCERAERRGGSEGFPIRHAPIVHRSVTHGKLGGYALEDE